MSSIIVATNPWKITLISSILMSLHLTLQTRHDDYDYDYIHAASWELGRRFHTVYVQFKAALLISDHISIL